MNEYSPFQLYTIGHSNRTLETFMEHLKQHGITQLIDVRSVPMSKYVPHFNKNVLEQTLPTHDMVYRFAGLYLGGRPDDKRVYTDGKPDYRKMLSSPFYVQGMVRLLNLIAQESQTGAVAVMCSEGDPLKCHRHHLIARSLVDPTFSVIEGSFDLAVYHILRDGRLSDNLTEADF